jgi:hypothetical protein
MTKTIVKKQISVHGIQLICEENKNKQILEIQFYNFYCIAISNTKTIMEKNDIIYFNVVSANTIIYLNFTSF